MNGVEVQALFFDDLRVEAYGKMSLMGLYLGELYLLDPENSPVDRLAVAISVKWPLEFTPTQVTVRILLPGQSPQDIPMPAGLALKPPDDSAGAFRNQKLFTSFNLRLAPLQAGDVVEAWLVVDGDALPAGRLRVLTQPNQTIE